MRNCNIKNLSTMLPVDNTRSLLISICQMADYIIFFRKYLNNCDKFKDLWKGGKFTCFINWSSPNRERFLCQQRVLVLCVHRV